MFFLIFRSFSLSLRMLRLNVSFKSNSLELLLFGFGRVHFLWPKPSTSISFNSFHATLFRFLIHFSTCIFKTCSTFNKQWLPNRCREFLIYFWLLYVYICVCSYLSYSRQISKGLSLTKNSFPFHQFSILMNIFRNNKIGLVLHIGRVFRSNENIRWQLWRRWKSVRCIAAPHLRAQPTKFYLNIQICIMRM